MIRARALIQQDTLAGWTTLNPILEDGVFAIEISTEEDFTGIKMKKGDSVRPYLDLPYIGGESALVHLIAESFDLETWDPVDHTVAITDEDAYVSIRWEGEWVGLGYLSKVKSLSGDVLLNKNGNLTGYNSIYAAVTASADGDTIILLKDLYLPSAVEIAKSIAVNGNGHAIDSAPGGEAFLARGGKTVKIYGFKRLAKSGTGSAEQRWIVAAGEPNTVLYLDTDEMYADQQNMALCYNQAKLFINARKIHVGGTNNNGFSRKFFCLDRGQMTVTGAVITDSLSIEAFYIGSVLKSGSYGDDDRSHLTFVRCKAQCANPFLHIERGGVGTIDQTEIDCLGDMPIYHLCVDLAGDKISKFVMKNSRIKSGDLNNTYYNACAYTAQGHGGIYYKYQAEFYGINYIEDNGLTANALTVFGSSPSDFNFKNFGVLHINKPTSNITFDHVAPIVI